MSAQRPLLPIVLAGLALALMFGGASAQEPGPVPPATTPVTIQACATLVATLSSAPHPVPDLAAADRVVQAHTACVLDVYRQRPVPPPEDPGWWQPPVIPTPDPLR
jgi:hypothetical protein